jgi:hypothetical protein
LRGGVHWYVAQAIPQIDAEIAQKDHFWMETSYHVRHGNANAMSMVSEVSIGEAISRDSLTFIHKSYMGTQS